LFGTAVEKLESNVVWGIVTTNPIMGSGVALFLASHTNLAATGSALDVASLGKARAAVAKQTGLDGKTVLNIRPAFLVVPSSLDLTAELEILTEGVIEIAKTPALQIDVGDRLFWDGGQQGRQQDGDGAGPRRRRRLGRGQPQPNRAHQARHQHAGGNVSSELAGSLPACAFGNTIIRISLLPTSRDGLHRDRPQ
jgi:hypothetical protein